MWDPICRDPRASNPKGATKWEGDAKGVGEPDSSTPPQAALGPGPDLQGPSSRGTLN